MQLYCRTGYHIGIFANGRIRGIDRDIDDFGKLFTIAFYLFCSKLEALY